jgi:membrane protease subunit HflK
MSNNSGGPWGNGGQGGDKQRPPRPQQRPGNDAPQIPELDEYIRKGQDQLRVLMGGKGGGGGDAPAGGSGGPGGGLMGLLVVVAAVGLWLMASFYTVRPEERSVELFLGEFSAIGEPGLNFAPWPVVTREVVAVTTERTEQIGTPARGRSNLSSLMLTTDENLVDVDFQVVWNVNDPAKFVFNLKSPEETVQAVSESVMREIVATSELAPLLNRDRGVTKDRAEALIQSTLDSYEAGISIVRVNLDKVEPPSESIRYTNADGQEVQRSVVDAFRDVQAAEQERDRLERQADAYANRVLAAARGEAAQIMEVAEGYRAQVVNDATGAASRFTAVLAEYQRAPEVTRKRLYLETMEQVLGDVEKIILDDAAAGANGVVPYLPLNELRKGGAN